MMIQLKYQIFVLSTLTGFMWCCQPRENKDFGADISANQQHVIEGRVSFELLCSSCHNFEQDAIGPNLSGLTRTVGSSWIRDFIKSPQKMVNEYDERATGLMKKYKAVMPDFPNLSDGEVDVILSYLHTYEELPATVTDSMISIPDPIKDTIPYSGILAHLDFIAQVPAAQNEIPLTRINKLACENKSGRLFVNDLSGILYEIKNGKAKPYLSLKESKPQFIDRPGMGSGFGSFALHPDFMGNGLLYTSHVETTGTEPADFKLPDSVKVLFQWVVTEWKSEDPNAPQFMGTSKEIMRFDFIASSHGVQELAFNPTAKKGDSDYGKLYICLGDGGSVQVGYPKIADHQGTDIWGSILRIDPQGNNSANGNYGIPKDNPFAGSASKRNEIWAYGFRNPNRISWDDSGRMLVSDIGQANIEELNIVEAGKFYGWPIREGTFLFNPNGDFNKVYPLPDNDAMFSVTYPILQYDHDVGPAISGGFTSKGKLYQGKYIFGDIATGKVYGSDLNTLGTPEIEELQIEFQNKKTTLNEMSGSSRADLKFGLGSDDGIYIFTKADGKIYKLREN